MLIKVYFIRVLGELRGMYEKNLAQLLASDTH